ncbi:MAG TPA: hypothetical protein V6D46_06355 [Coleofasciculaceae cyanobacterium]
MAIELGGTGDRGCVEQARSSQAIENSEPSQLYRCGETGDRAID